jgi:nucleoside-diphosphate-sugar epimerase
VGKVRVAVTGASGHLGQYICQRLKLDGHKVIPVGRQFPKDLEADIIWHLAAPNHRNDDDCSQFMWFNDAVAMSGIPVINTGTWWQYAGQEAAGLYYTRIKQEQQAMFDTTLVLFSVYGSRPRNARGFIPQLIDYANGVNPIVGASRQQRDWVHVSDVFTAFLAATWSPAGVYDIATGTTFSPYELTLAVVGESLPDYQEFPNCAPQYDNQQLANWNYKVNVLSYIRTLAITAST